MTRRGRGHDTGACRFSLTRITPCITTRDMDDAMTYPPTDTCEVCSKPCNTGVRCDSCYAADLRACLGSAGWRQVAATRTGDLPGETMLDTVRRTYRRLNTPLQEDA